MSLSYLLRLLAEPKKTNIATQQIPVMPPADCPLLNAQCSKDMWKNWTVSLCIVSLGLCTRYSFKFWFMLC